MKFVIAVLIVGFSALMLGYGFQIWPGGQDLSPWWFLALVYVIQTVAELFLTPVGLATTTALAPRSFASQAMGLWWLSVAAGQGSRRVHHRPDRGHLRRHLLLRPGCGHAPHGPGAVRRRPVDAAADGRCRGGHRRVSRG